MTAHTLEVGDEVFIGGIRGRGGHGAYIIIDKINKKSVKGHEKKGSYVPGMEWRLGVGIEIALVTYDGERVDPEKGLITGLMRTHWGYMYEGNVIIY